MNKYDYLWKKPLSVALASALVAGGLSGAWAPQRASAAGSDDAIVVSPGNVIYGVGSQDAIAIDPALLLDGDVLEQVATQTLNGATVLIDTGYVSGDKLALELTEGFSANITGSFNANTGILTLSGEATVEEYEEALQHVVFSTTSQELTDRTVKFTLGKALPFGENNHYYEYVNIGSPITWTAAKDQAASKTHFGLKGYLATITSEAENNFVYQKTEGLGWLGAQDIERSEGEQMQTGDWRWVTGPEGLEDEGNGLAFYKGYNQLPDHGAVDEEYNNWAAGEPNNHSGNEYVAHIYSTGANAGTWNDFSPTNTNVGGYIIEFGGMPDDQPIVITGAKTIDVVSKVDLSAEIQEADELAEENYVPATWQAFEDALEAAQAVLDNPGATQDEIDAALADLTDARDALVHVDVELNITAPAGSTVKVAKPEFTGTVGDKDATVTITVRDADGGVVETKVVEVDEDGKWSYTPSADLDAGEYTFEATAVKGNETHTESKPFTVDLSSLSNLGLKDPSGNAIALSPAFASGTEAYTATVGNHVGYTTLNLEALSEGGTIEYSLNGGDWKDAESGEAPDQLPLSVGENTIIVKVTDAKGHVTEYTLKVTRNAPASNPWPVYYPPVTSEPPVTGTQPGTGSGDLVTSVNGDAGDFATGTTAEQQTTAKVDLDKLGAVLSQGKDQQLTIQSPSAGQLQVEGLTAATLQQLADQGTALEIGHPLAIYPVPAGHLDLSGVSGRLGQAEAKDIQVNIEIARASEELIASSRARATEAGYEMLVDPVALDLTFSHNGQTVRSELLSGYAAKYIALPEGIDPNRITTGVVVYPDGSAYHVPTVVTRIGDRYYAQINDLRSYGTYSVIWNPQDFDDVRTHWGQSDVNNISARLDLKGNGNNTFSPNRQVTRAEFADIVVTGLGLMDPQGLDDLFPDVSSMAWYRTAVSIAQEFGIILGYDDGNFYGQQTLTREQGFAIVARAHRLIDPKAALSGSAVEGPLAGFEDGAAVATWARADVAQLIQAGIIQGQGRSLIDPKAGMTRAEVTALISSLLKTTKLIDNN